MNSAGLIETVFVHLSRTVGESKPCNRIESFTRDIDRHKLEYPIVQSHGTLGSIIINILYRARCTPTIPGGRL